MHGKLVPINIQPGNVNLSDNLIATASRDFNFRYQLILRMQIMEAFEIKRLTRTILILLLSVTLAAAIRLPCFAQGSLYHFREFTVTLEKFPPDKNPYTSVVITLDGRGVYRRVFKRKNLEMAKTLDFELSVKQLEFLYYRIMRNNFFELGKTYGDPDMTEGNIIRITVKIDNQTHTVTMYDERYLAADDVAKTILEVVPEKFAKTFRDDYDGSEDRIDINLEED